MWKCSWNSKPRSRLISGWDVTPEEQQVCEKVSIHICVKKYEIQVCIRQRQKKFQNWPLGTSHQVSENNYKNFVIHDKIFNHLWVQNQEFSSRLKVSVHDILKVSVRTGSDNRWPFYRNVHNSLKRMIYSIHKSMYHCFLKVFAGFSCIFPIVCI